MALAWVLHRKVTSVIIGVNSVEELEENMKALTHENVLSQEEVKQFSA